MDGPDVSKAQRRLLPNQLAFIPRCRCTGDFSQNVHGMFLHQVEVKEWVNSCTSCAKVNLKSGLDLERTFMEMQQESEFWLYGLMEINDQKDHRLGRIYQAAFAEKSASTFIQS